MLLHGVFLLLALVLACVGAPAAAHRAASQRKTSVTAQLSVPAPLRTKFSSSTHPAGLAVGESVPAPLRTKFSSTPCLRLCVPGFQVLHACASAYQVFKYSMLAPLHVRFCSSLDEARGQSLCCSTSLRRCSSGCTSRCVATKNVSHSTAVRPRASAYQVFKYSMLVPLRTKFSSTPCLHLCMSGFALSESAPMHVRLCSS